jgi:heme-degrading monooxygenase HmoA
MAVLVRHRVSGMTPEQYDQSAPPLIASLRTQPGFLYHVAFVDEGGTFTVSEIWESKEQHDRWFSENVEGVIPGIEQQVIKVHAVVTSVKLRDADRLAHKTEGPAGVLVEDVHFRDRADWKHEHLGRDPLHFRPVALLDAEKVVNVLGVDIK